MNLEDFKSFRRVLKPSEVGSIPTHSRHALALVLWCALAAGAAAQEPAEPTAPMPVPEAARDAAGPPDTTLADAGPSPFAVAVRSALVPAWGQVSNGREVKAAVLFSVEAYVWTRVVIHTKRGREWEDRVDALTAEGAPDAEVAVARRRADEHYGTRRDLLFWAFVGAFYGAIDAYVDAHLGDFEKELEDGRELFGSAGPGGVQLGIRF